MDYISTRSSDVKVKSCTAIKQGISSEGGLFVPAEIPYVDLKEIEL